MPVIAEIESLHAEMTAWRRELRRLKLVEEMISATLGPQRFAAALIGSFGLIGLLLSAIGLYGVIAYTVAQRTREVGLRVALGATRGHVFRLVIGSGAWTITAGLLFGLAAAALTTRLLAGQLYGVEPLDPPTLAGAVLVLAVVAMQADVRGSAAGLCAAEFYRGLQEGSPIDIATAHRHVPIEEERAQVPQRLAAPAPGPRRRRARGRHRRAGF